ncbi:MAG: hypothetical protein IT210_15155 [Armatimonadetes bacterium]|nr:hypothetical protein [Armatimonadota bacterium]
MYFPGVHRWGPVFGLLACLLLPRGAEAAKDDGYLTGCVRQTGGSAPIAGALIAAYDEKGRVLASGQTDAEGRYQLLVPRDSLPLPEARRRGSLFSQVVRGVGRGMKRLVGLTAQVAQTMAAGNAGSAAGKAVAGAAAREGASKIATEMSGKVTERAVSGAVDPSGGRPSIRKRAAEKPAVVILPSVRVRVVHPDHQEFNDEVASYWFESPRVGEKRRVAEPSSALMDDIFLAPEGSPADSETLQTGMILYDFDIEPAIASPGTWVDLSVKIAVPPSLSPDFEMIAKDTRTKQWIEMSPSGGGEYRGRLPVDKKTPADDHILTVLALRRKPAFAEPFKKMKGEIRKGIDRKDLWNPKKPYAYDPQLLAGRNRPEGILTVVKPKR